MPLFTWTVTHGLQRVGGEGPVYGTANPQMLVRHLTTLTIRAVFHLKDLHAHLTDATVARGVRDIAQAFLRTGSTAVLSGESIHLPGELAREAIPFALHLPNRDELQHVVHQTLHALKAQRNLTVTLGPDGMESLLQALSGLTLNQARQTIAWAVLDDAALTAQDIPRLLRRKGEAVREEGLLEFYPSDDNAYELGGFEHLKAWLERARVLDAARLYDKFIGESERNLRKALDFAEAIAPSILWIDEIEKGFAAGGEADAGLSQRILGSFLTWLQERQAPVFVAATANDVLALPPELLRKGRFDEIFFVDLPDPADREAIFRIHLALRHQDPSKFDLRGLVAASEGFSGAEIEQVITAGLYRALHDRQPLTDVMLCEEMRGTQPLSVSRREDVERLRDMARGRFVPV
jgi:hypothetical protein